MRRGAGGGCGGYSNHSDGAAPRLAGLLTDWGHWVTRTQDQYRSPSRVKTHVPERRVPVRHVPRVFLFATSGFFTGEWAAGTAAKRKCNVGIINSPHPPPCRQKNSQQLNVGWCCEQSKQTIDNDNGPSPTFLLPGCWVAGWSIPRCTVGAAPHTRYLWSGCLIDHLRPNQVNFYKRRRLVLLGFYPSQSIHGLDSR